MNVLGFVKKRFCYVSADVETGYFVEYVVVLLLLFA